MIKINFCWWSKRFLIDAVMEDSKNNTKFEKYNFYCKNVFFENYFKKHFWEKHFFLLKNDSKQWFANSIYISTLRIWFRLSIFILDAFFIKIVASNFRFRCMILFSTFLKNVFSKGTCLPKQKKESKNPAEGGGIVDL